MDARIIFFIQQSNLARQPIIGTDNQTPPTPLKHSGWTTDPAQRDRRPRRRGVTIPALQTQQYGRAKGQGAHCHWEKKFRPRDVAGAGA